MRLPLHDGHVDLSSGDVVRDGQPAHRLREKERQLLAFLAERSGQVVPRGTLYTDIWGYHPQTRSRTLDSTVRRLRKAIEATPRSPRHVLSVPGEGYRFVVAESEGAPAPAPSRPTTPYLPRPADEARLQELLSLWRVVTVVGPGGVGKTRVTSELVQSWPEPLVRLEVGSLTTLDGADGLRDALAHAAGMTAKGWEALNATLQRRHVLCLLDEAEVHLDEVRSLVDALPDVSFLLTSRRPLGRGDEAVHQLGRLDAHDGATFLSQRLAASRWGADASPDDIDEAVALLDGLPLALELAAAHPDGLLHVVESLRQQTLPDDAMRAPLEASLARLSASERDLLRRMCLCEAPLRTDDLVSWLGPEARDRLRTLVDRSLVERRGRGWGLLRTTRVAVRSTDADWPTLRAELDAWLATRAIQLAREIAVAPGRAMAHLGALLEDLLESLPRQPIAAAPWLGQALFRHADNQSSLSLVERIARATDARAPGHPMTRILRVAAWWDPPGSIADLLSHSDVQIRSFAMEMMAAMRPDLLDADAVEATAAGKHGLTPHQAAVLRTTAVVARALPPQRAADALQRLLPATEALPSARMELLRTTGEMLRLARQPRAAIRCLDEAIALAERHNPTGGFVNHHMRSRALGDLDPLRGYEAHLATATDLSQAGGFEAFDYVRAGVLAFVLGRDDDAGDLVGAYLLEVQGETRVLGEAVHTLLRLRAGVPGTRAVLPSSDDAADSPNGRLRHFLDALLASEAARLSGQPSSRAEATEALSALVPDDAHQTAWQLLHEHLQRLS